MQRGKYARICVEVDLDKPLLPMFEIKNHIYKVEYEGLHLLCLACGKYGHYREHCNAKDKGEQDSFVGSAEERLKSTGDGVKVREEGPWTVVQKPRWSKKGKAATIATRVPTVNVNGGARSTGSRFNVLINEDQAMHDNREDVQVVGEIHATNDMSVPKLTNVVEKQKGRVIGKSSGAHAHHTIASTINSPQQLVIATREKPLREYSKEVSASRLFSSTPTVTTGVKLWVPRY